jgi:hypothetical protein
VRGARSRRLSPVHETSLHPGSATSRDFLCPIDRYQGADAAAKSGKVESVVH